jgi:cell fate (sporulation/competence/biofilm development) regulator YlbF (YheA/YmcA/DUF963 family)
MDKNIHSVLDSLIKANKDGDVYQAYKFAEKRWTAAKKSQQLLQDFIEARNTLHVFKQGNFPGIEEQKVKLKDLYAQVQDDADIQEWTEAQEEYQKSIWDQAQYLTDGLGLDFAPQAKGCCC